MIPKTESSYENILLKKLHAQGVGFFSIIVLEGPHILKFIAPPSFMSIYLEKQLYNHDPLLTVPQSSLGFYLWSQLEEGQEILTLIKEMFSISQCESLILAKKQSRLVLTVGYQKLFSLSDWFFKEKPNFDHLLAE